MELSDYSRRKLWWCDEKLYFFRVMDPLEKSGLRWKARPAPAQLWWASLWQQTEKSWIPLTDYFFPQLPFMLIFLVSEIKNKYWKKGNLCLNDRFHKKIKQFIVRIKQKLEKIQNSIHLLILFLHQIKLFGTSKECHAITLEMPLIYCWDSRSSILSCKAFSALLSVKTLYLDKSNVTFYATYS